ncbi:MAG: hypothetical protein IKT82_03610 [Bacteroidaceae bacterium]|nr:hypothetical protein [Bacteroidaceae bacterium]
MKDNQEYNKLQEYNDALDVTDAPDTEDALSAETSQGDSEVPIIIIEREEDTDEASYQPAPVRKSRMKVFLLVVVLLLSVACAIMGTKVWDYYHNLNISISVTPAENIQKLQQPPLAEPTYVEMTSDSILGVALDIYALHGVQGSLEFEEPDTTDASVYLYCRSSDFTAEGRYHGSLVINGEVYAEDTDRWGYMAMVGENSVIGVSSSDEVMHFVKEQGGDFFRQFVLVSNGELPSRFQLHGKVERCAIGRMGDTLYYITSRHKETMWSFADALREYGFIDAIYITGGSDYSFCRDRKGKRIDIHNPEDYPHQKWAGITPWLVFRQKR